MYVVFFKYYKKCYYASCRGWRCDGVEKRRDCLFVSVLEDGMRSEDVSETSSNYCFESVLKASFSSLEYGRRIWVLNMVSFLSNRSIRL